MRTLAAVALVIGLGGETARAYVTVFNGETVEWSISGIADSSIRKVDNLYPDAMTYAADIRPGQSYELRMRMNPTQTNAIAHGYRIWIPGFNRMAEAAVGDLTGTAGEQSFGLTEHYFPNQTYFMLELLYVCYCMVPVNCPSHPFQFVIWIIPNSSLGIGFNAWRKGLPPCPADFMPPLGHKPEGCAKCSTMGLPSYRVNTATLNLVVQDTDFAASGVGPDLDLTRTYNSDPETSGMFGRSWSFTYESRLSADYTLARVDKGTGQTLFFGVPTNALAGGGVYTNWNGTYESPGGGETDRLQVTTNATGQTLYLLREQASGIVHAYANAARFGSNIPLAYVEDRSGNRLTLDYDAFGRLQAVHDPVGRTATFNYNAQNFCTRLTAPNGATADYAYTNGNLAWTRDLVGTVTSFTYDTNHYLTQFSTAGRTWTATRWPGKEGWTYVDSITDPLGNMVRYTPTSPAASNQVVQVMDAEYHILSRHHGRQFQIWKTENALGEFSQQTFLTNGLPATNRNARGLLQSMAYDARRNLTRHVAEDAAVTTLGYDSNDLVIATTNALGGVTRLVRDAQGHVLRTILPSGRYADATYNSRGQVLTQKDFGGNTTSFTYDTNGLLTAVTDPEGYTTRFGYDSNRLDITSVTNALGYVTRLTWDANRRLQKTINPDGTYNERLYDCCAPYGQRDENGQMWTVVRDALLRPTQIMDPLGRAVRQEYDERGNLTKIQDADGRVKLYQYDLADRMVAVTNALGVANAALTYDANGNLNQVYLPTKPMWAPPASVGYDSRDRLNNWSRGFTGTRYAYDLLGRLSAMTNGRNQTLKFDYDPDGQLLRKTEGATTLAEYTYEAGGTLHSMTDATGTTVFGHDRRQLVTNIVYPDGLRVAMQYDGLGRLTALDYPGGLRVNYAYDALDRVTNMTWAGQALSFAYDAVGRLLSETRANGGSSQYGYNAAGRLTNLVHQLPANLLVRLRYDRNASGEVTNVVKVSGVLPMRPPFAPVTNTFSTTLPGFAETWNGLDVNYDFDGNRTGFGDPAVDPASYDAENRLIALTRGTNSASYTYDGLGRMARAVRNGQERRCHYDHAGRLLFETDASGAVKACYFYRGRGLVALESAQGGTHYYHFDHLGSTLALSDSAGKVSAIYRYLPYGEVASRLARVDNPFTFVGKYGVRDEGQGFFFMKARFYDARTGRFMQEDPLLMKGGLNTYAYAANNPVNWIDPEGSDEEDVTTIDQMIDEYVEKGVFAKDTGTRFSGITGQVEIARPIKGVPMEEWGWVTAKLDSVINTGDVIRTSEDSSCILSFSDMSTFVMKPEQTITMTTPPEKETAVRLMSRNVWKNIKKMLKDGSMEIETNQCVAGIKG